MPYVSVVMAVYNGEPYLREAVDSILGQTFADFEFLIVDDGSTDGSGDILASYLDPRVRVFSNERNLGLARSLNRGLSAARGRLVARQDADDVSEADRLARQVAFLEAHPDIVLAGACYRVIDMAGAVTGPGRLPLDDRAIRWALLFFCPFVHTAVMFRRVEVLREIGLYDERLTYSMDYDLWARMARRFRMVNLPEPLVRVRSHPTSMTATYGERTREGTELRRAAVSRLLGTDVDAGVAAAMQALAVGEAHHPGSAQDLACGARRIVELHAAFCSASALGAAERRTHGALVRRQLRSQLAKAALSRAGRLRFRDALHLLAAAAATLPRAARPRLVSGT